MELWVRSQDRETLVKINRIDVDDCQIQGNHIDIDYVVLGNYKSKERALEVLDEIQDILTPKMVYKNITKDVLGIEQINQQFKNNVHFNTTNNGDIHFINNTYIYEMPKE